MKTFNESLTSFAQKYGYNLLSAVSPAPISALLDTIKDCGDTDQNTDCDNGQVTVKNQPFQVELRRASVVILYFMEDVSQEEKEEILSIIANSGIVTDENGDICMEEIEEDLIEPDYFYNDCMIYLLPEPADKTGIEDRYIKPMEEALHKYELTEIRSVLFA